MEEVEFEVGSSSGVETEVVWVRIPLVMKAGVEEREGLRWSYIVDRGLGGWIWGVGFGEGGEKEEWRRKGREGGRKDRGRGRDKDKEEEEEKEERRRRKKRKKRKRKRFSLPRRLVFLALCK